MLKGLAGGVALAMLLCSPLAAQDYPDVVSQSHYVPVRDGTRLAVSIYRPANGTTAASTRLPVIFSIWRMNPSQTFA